ncbi:MAG: hypothetical protein KatS3mg077_2230 [Candidatus Binatia bacterium]|nr:MAG: hypothetical protein KatS3mg077_2230 [Candidatus Binatia bacterium]
MRLMMTKERAVLSDLPAKPGKRRLLSALAVAAVLGVLALGHAFHAQDHILGLVEWIRHAGWMGLVVFIIVYVAATVLFVPGAILTLGAGFAYGVVLGSLAVLIAANLGAILAFWLGRTVARDWVAARVQSNPRFAAIDRAVGHEGFKIVLLTRLSPVFPFNLLNYAFGVTSVRASDYVIGSALGMFPGTVMYVYAGSLITSATQLASGQAPASQAQTAFYFFGFAATLVVTLYITRLARRALAAITEESAFPESGAPARPQPETVETAGLRVKPRP